MNITAFVLTCITMFLTLMFLGLEIFYPHSAFFRLFLGAIFGMFGSVVLSMVGYGVYMLFATWLTELNNGKD
jgi:hypothetical protein